MANDQTPPTDFQTVTGLAAHPRPHLNSAESGNIGRTNCNRASPAVQAMAGNATVGPGSFFPWHLIESYLRCFLIAEKLMLLQSCSKVIKFLVGLCQFIIYKNGVDRFNPFYWYICRGLLKKIHK